MPREKPGMVDRATLLRALERASSTVAVVEDGAWDVDHEVAIVLLEACMTIERAIMQLKREDVD